MSGTMQSACTQPLAVVYWAYTTPPRALLLKQNIGFFSFLDHLTLMFGEELPPWDTNRKYSPQNLQVSSFYFALLVSLNSFGVISSLWNCFP